MEDKSDERQQIEFDFMKNIILSKVEKLLKEDRERFEKWEQNLYASLDRRAEKINPLWKGILLVCIEAVVLGIVIAMVKS